MKTIFFSLLISILFLSVGNAQLRQDLKNSRSLSGPIIDPTVPSIDEDLASDTFYISTLSSDSASYLDLQYTMFTYDVSTPMYLHPYKYDCTVSNNCLIGLNQQDNFPQVMGKIGVQYLIERFIK